MGDYQIRFMSTGWQVGPNCELDHYDVGLVNNKLVAG